MSVGICRRWISAVCCLLVTAPLALPEAKAQANPGFIDSPVRAVDASVGHDGTLWAAGLDGKPYRYDAKQKKFLVHGTLKDVVRIDGAPDGGGLAVTKQGDIFFNKGAQDRNWNKVGVRTLDIGVGGGWVWVANSNMDKTKGGGEVWRSPYDGSGHFKWSRVGGRIVKVDVGPDGHAWATDSNNDIHRFDGKKWVQVPGKGVDIAVGPKGQPWMLTTDFAKGRNGATPFIYDLKKKRWVKRGGKFGSITVTMDGHVAGVDAHNKIVIPRAKAQAVATAKPAPKKQPTGKQPAQPAGGIDPKQSLSALANSFDLIPGLPAVVGNQLKNLPSDLKEDATGLIGSYKNMHFALVKGKAYKGIPAMSPTLLVKGKLVPKLAGPLWNAFVGSSLRDPIFALGLPGAARIYKAKKLPGEMGKTVASSYGGSLDILTGIQVHAGLELKGNLRTALGAMNFPSNGVLTMTAGVMPGGKKGGKASKVPPTGTINAIIRQAVLRKIDSKLTRYVQMAHRGGIWKDPFAIPQSELSGTTIYLDSAARFGLWGNLKVGGDRYVAYYSGPYNLGATLKAAAANPKAAARGAMDYQLGFAADKISLRQAMKLMTVASLRGATGPAALLSPVQVAQGKASEGLFKGLDALPLDLIQISNKNLKGYQFKPGSPFPGPENFNILLLGPLAEAKDGTQGPLARVFGDAQFLGQTFGDFDLTFDKDGLRGTGQTKTNLKLGKLGSTGLGALSGTATLTVNATRERQVVSLAGRVNGGLLGGRDIRVDVLDETVTVTSPASCAFPVDVRYSYRYRPPTPKGGAPKGGLDLSKIKFGSPINALPDPKLLVKCTGNIYAMLKNGVVTVFNGTTKLAEFAENTLPPGLNKVPLSKGLKFAGGKVGEATAEIKNVIAKVPGMDHLDGGARKAKEAAAKTAKKAAEEARKAGEAAKDAFAGAGKFTGSVVNGAAGRIAGALSDPVGSVSNAIKSAFGGGSKRYYPPTAGWRHDNKAQDFLDIAVSHGNHVWGVQKSGRVYMRNGTRWVERRGRSGFKRIDAHWGGTAVAVDQEGRIWFNNGQWHEVKGQRAIDVGIGGDWIWIIGTQKTGGGYVMHRARYDRNGQFKWQHIPGGAIRLDVDKNGNAWVINDQHKVYQYHGNRWHQKAGTASDITISDAGDIWVTGTGYHHANGGSPLFRYVHQNDGWLGYNDRGIAISAGKSGKMWVINSHGRLYESDGSKGQPPNKVVWRKSRDALALDIDVGQNGDVWAVGQRDSHAWWYDAAADLWHGHRHWRGDLNRIDVAPDGGIFAVTKDGTILFSRDRNSGWVTITGKKAVDIAVGGGWIYILSTDKNHGQNVVFRASYGDKNARSRGGDPGWRSTGGWGIHAIDVDYRGRALIRSGNNGRNEFWQYPVNNKWVRHAGAGVDIAVAHPNSIWAAGTNYDRRYGGGGAFRYKGGNAWEGQFVDPNVAGIGLNKAPGFFERIAVAPDGTVYGVNSYDEVYVGRR
ncbi:tectonin domain-containing protein [Magnetospira sp. QH-2]|uniref:tectonin domain-containing protein n=1 Tax=Magnetospira sp. (strain QH-2) TaxID=1288970 RepID=UPI0003E81B12|nr:tectonin domain-containing protein [Magnetospira sp. QH-2]CCQ74378.1 Protein of unknown function [Magnetospira sp. QH-2]